MAVIDALFRERFGHAGQSYLKRTADADAGLARHRLDLLLDQTLGLGRMGGDDWDELTMLLTGTCDVHLYPSRLWNEVTDRLVAEMLIARGTGWLQRSEAVSRLLGHETGVLTMISSCAAVVADANNQVFIDPLATLEVTRHRDASRHVLLQIRNPTNEQARRGAWWTTAEKAGRGHFSAREVQQLIRCAVEVLDDPLQHPDCRVAAAETLRHTAGSAGAMMSSKIAKVVALDHVSGNVYRIGHLASLDAINSIARRVAAAAIRHLPRDVLGQDPILEALVREALFHPRMSRRFVANKLLEATPHRIPLANALLAELKSRTVVEDPALAPNIVSTLTTLGDTKCKTILQRFILSVGTPSAVVERGLWSLGHLQDCTTALFWAGAMQRFQQNISAARGIVYSAGVERQTDLLRRFRANVALAPAVRTAASWWLNLPGHVLSSAENHLTS